MSQEDERQTARRERLEAELRANLKRRKEQARARRERGSAMDETGVDPDKPSGESVETKAGHATQRGPNGLQTQ